MPAMRLDKNPFPDHVADQITGEQVKDWPTKKHTSKGEFIALHTFHSYPHDDVPSQTLAIVRVYFLFLLSQQKNSMKEIAVVTSSFPEKEFQEIVQFDVEFHRQLFASDKKSYYIGDLKVRRWAKECWGEATLRKIIYHDDYFKNYQLLISEDSIKRKTGFIMFHLSTTDNQYIGKFVNIDSIYVAKWARRNGHGKQLIDACKKQAKEKWKCSVIRLHCFHENKGAYAFYDKYGFDKKKVEKDNYKPGFLVVRMEMNF